MLIDQTQAFALAWRQKIDSGHNPLEAYGGPGTPVNDALAASSTFASMQPSQR